MIFFIDAEKRNFFLINALNISNDSVRRDRYVVLKIHNAIVIRDGKRFELRFYGGRSKHISETFNKYHLLKFERKCYVIDYLYLILYFCVSSSSIDALSEIS